jgi:hypothetical protein
VNTFLLREKLISDWRSISANIHFPPLLPPFGGRLELSSSGGLTSGALNDILHQGWFNNAIYDDIMIIKF